MITAVRKILKVSDTSDDHNRRAAEIADQIVLDLWTQPNRQILQKLLTEGKMTTFYVDQLRKIAKISLKQARICWAKCASNWIRDFQSKLWKTRCDMMIQWETSKGITHKDKTSKSADQHKANAATISRREGHHTTVARNRPLVTDRDLINDTQHDNDDLMIPRPKEPQKEQLHVLATRWVTRVNAFIISYELMDWIASPFHKFKLLYKQEDRTRTKDKKKADV